MSHTLSIEPSSRVVGGFQQEAPEISKIIEGANISGTLLNKLGTSIPTPFARLHLFNSAFKELNAADNAYAQEVGANYEKLASLALDMFEFLYLYGASSRLTILYWNMVNQAKALKNSIQPGHSELGEALQAAWLNGGYGEQGIYLFKFGDDIIGGTSPLSVFYTNPNLTKTFQGLSEGHKLFDTNNPCSLEDRALEFRMYLYKLFKTYSAAFTGTELGQYISNHLNRDMSFVPQIKNEIDAFSALTRAQMESALGAQQNGNQPYTQLMFNNTPLIVGGVTLWVKDLSNISFNSDYKIKSSVGTYSNININGAQRTLRQPLVLNEFGLNNARYVDSTLWSMAELPASDVQVPLHERKLPGTEITYPYLRAEDFFQEKIIDLSYNVHKDKFYTGLEEDTTFLLPLKREFFKYFRPEDLQGMLQIKKDYAPDGQLESVTATLKVPLEGGRDLPLEKIYSRAEQTIVNAKLTNNTFNMAFFPFYKDNSETADNSYDVMLASSIKGAGLSFYNLENPDYRYEPLELHGEVSDNVRTEKGGNSILETHHYNINRPFDIVEISVQTDGRPASGLVLPKMKEIDTANPMFDYVFGVDFGTTNTQVAFACNNGNIESFHIRLDNKDEEIQTVYLNNHTIKDGKHQLEYGFGLFGEMASMSRREFVTSEMDKNLFPIRTAICEVRNLDLIQNPRLFGHLNIGFNYTHEMTTGSGDNRYRTDLKWDDTDLNARTRTQIFFQELLMLMRNKSILNNGNRDIKVVVTYPQAMNGRLENDFKTDWRLAAEAIDLDPENIKFHYESIAPYYSFSRTQGLNDTYVNMDIGGGSTDILYYNPTSNEKMTFSVMFAGNDIWGDGCNPLLAGGRNGFIKHYEASNRYRALSNNLQQDYQTVKINSSQGSVENRSQRSSDIINYLFKNDANFNFTDDIKNSEMALLPIMHFTSLIYYLGHIAESQDLSMPKVLSFTGMGSLYLKMLGTEKQLGKLAGVILNHKNQTKGSSIEILFAPRPKNVTAEGAVTISLANQRGIELIKTEPGLCFGIIDEEPDTRLEIGNIKNGLNGKRMLDLVVENYKEIIDMMYDDEDFRDVITDMGFDKALNALPPKDKLEAIFNESFNICVQNFKRLHSDENDKNKVKESLFFWPLKNGLYMLGEYLTSGIKPNHNN